MVGIRMDLRENGWEGTQWIHLAQDRDRWRNLVNAVMNLRVLAPRSYLLSYTSPMRVLPLPSPFLLRMIPWLFLETWYQILLQY
jgi:hypothetical protein